MNSRLYVAAVIGGVLALALTLVLVFQFGRHNPSPPSLRDDPNAAIPGKILYINENQCAVVAEASGASSEEVYCFGQSVFPGALYWVDETTIAYLEHGQRTSVVRIDLVTGEKNDPEPITITDPWNEGRLAPDGTEAVIEEGGKVVLVKDGVRTEVADFDVSRNSWPQPMLWSPDGEWLVLSYYPPRGGASELWIMSRDGEVRGTLAKESRGQGVAWWIEGVGSWPELPE